DAFIFLAHKKEELVFLDWTVEVPSEIVEAQLRFHRREEKSRVEFVVTEKLEGAAVIRVAATARDDIDRGAGVAPVFSREVRSLNFNFLNKVDADIVDLAVVAARVHIETAIDREAVVVGPVTVHCCLTDTQACGQR